ncbi:MAG: aldose 1-epimerase family protein [Ruminococcaceae bacterium]|nr:aldose 1-epimerase family protein [Oscillospiraceae bacterium]
MSKIVTLKNSHLTAFFSDKGAELHSLKTISGKEYIFRDTNVWEYSSPILFPICGGLKDGKFVYGGKEYFLPKHGFVKDALFSIEKVDENSVTFFYRDNEKTLKVYPFSFELRIIYTLDKSSLSVDYCVKNTGNEKMYYSIGAHEAYFCPEGINNYSIVFDKSETLDSHIVNGNLLDYKTERILTDSNTLKLDYKYFSVDALVFSKFNSKALELVSVDLERRIRLEFSDFSHLLLWTQSDANKPYICIEPWCGFPDMTDSVYDITHRPGILQIAPGETQNINHKLTVLK